MCKMVCVILSLGYCLNMNLSHLVVEFESWLFSCVFDGSRWLDGRLGVHKFDGNQLVFWGSCRSYHLENNLIFLSRSLILCWKEYFNLLLIFLLLLVQLIFSGLAKSFLPPSPKYSLIVLLKLLFQQAFTSWFLHMTLSFVSLKNFSFYIQLLI